MWTFKLWFDDHSEKTGSRHRHVNTKRGLSCWRNTHTNAAVILGKIVALRRVEMFTLPVCCFTQNSQRGEKNIPFWRNPERSCPLGNPRWEMAICCCTKVTHPWRHNWDSEDPQIKLDYMLTSGESLDVIWLRDSHGWMSTTFLWMDDLLADTQASILSPVISQTVFLPQKKKKRWDGFACQQTRVQFHFCAFCWCFLLMATIEDVDPIVFLEMVKSSKGNHKCARIP